jgi:transposase
MAAFPKSWREIFTLATFMVASGEPLMYCNDWLHSHDSLPVMSLASQRISELLGEIRADEREGFYALWGQSASCETEYLALDISSESSYSELIGEVEWGYNRDHENLTQINVCVLFGESSRLPIYQTVYNGSLKDVSTLETTLKKFHALVGGKKFVAVMDKGFYSHRNVTRMLGDEKHPPVDFLIAMPFTAAFAKKLVESERKDIDRVENTIVINGYSMRAVTHERTWNTDKKVFAHVYYSAKKANGIREGLFSKVALLRKAAEKDPTKYAANSECKKYLNIRKSEKHPSGYTITIKSDVIDSELSTAGWMVLISNTISNAKTAMTIYRDKDVVEKGVLQIKNNIDLGRLRVHSSEGMENKMFIGFIASVLMSEINRVIADRELYKTYTMTEMLKLLERQKVQYIKGERILFPISKSQREVFEAFGLKLPLLL